MQNEIETLTETEGELFSPEIHSTSLRMTTGEKSVENDAVDTAVEDVDPCAEETAEPQSSADDELTALRDEISSLRAELESRDRALARMHDELSEFSELYPDRVLTSLPNEVWEGVRAGLPLAASVAYCEAKQRRREAIAAEVNRRNSAASSGSVDGADVEFYSPDEVRAMNAAQVRQNYSKIIDSMKLWN